MLSVDKALSYNQDAIGIGRKGTIDKPYILKAPFWTVDTLFYCIPKENLNLKFLFGIFQKIKWKSMDESTGVPSLSKTAINNIIIYTPSLKEQEKIGKFLLLLEHAITLHQRKLEVMKQLKQAYLQQLFPEQDSKVPNLRFTNFRQDWEQRKLFDIGKISTGNTPPTKDSENYSDDGMLWVTPTDINSLVIKDTTKRLSKKGQQNASKVNSGSILVTCIASIGKNTMVSESSSFNQQINALTPFSTYDSYFLLTQSFCWSRKMKSIASSGTMQIVNKTEFSNLVFMFPKLSEQKKIGSFFNIIDNTIDLHQQKLTKLEQLKSAYLQKMFI